MNGKLLIIVALTLCGWGACSPATAHEVCGNGMVCTDSGVCDLTADGSAFECRPPRSRCEAGFDVSVAAGPLAARADSGALLAQQSCEARAGCAFVQAGACYCPPGIECFCGGGSPPQCIEALQ